MAKNDLEALERELTSFVDRNQEKKDETKRVPSPPTRRPLEDDEDESVPQNQTRQASPSSSGRFGDKKFAVSPPPSLKSATSSRPKFLDDDEDDDEIASKIHIDDDPLPHDEDERHKSRISMIFILGIAALVVILGLALWFVYNQGVVSGSETAAPTLRLDGPIKMQPDSLASATVGQDSELFERIDGIEDQATAPSNNQGNSQITEDTMPADPMARQPRTTQQEPATSNQTPPPPSISTPEQGDQTSEAALTVGDAPPQSTVQAPTASQDSPPTPEITAGQADQATSQDNTSQDSFIPPSNDTGNDTAAIPAQANQAEDPPAGSIPASGTGWRIQIAALPSLDEARGFWQSTRGRFPGVLNGLNFSTETVVVNETQYYRVRGGPLPNRQTAERICDTLKAQGQACIIVKP